MAPKHEKIHSSRLTIGRRVPADITSTMGCLSIKVCETDPLAVNRDEGLTSGSVEEWIAVETQSTVREYILNDAMDDALELGGARYNNESDSSDDDGD